MHKSKEDRRNARTTREQLALIARRPGKSADETARLKGESNHV